MIRVTGKGSGGLTDQFSGDEERVGPSQIYIIQLQVVHPHCQVAGITAGLGIDPDEAFDVGHRMPPYGSGPAAGAYKNSVWYKNRRIEGQRHFSVEVFRLLEWLESKHQFVSELVDSGGTVSVNIQLGGARNIGDTLPPALLRRVAALNVSLGIEVFPSL